MKHTLKFLILNVLLISGLITHGQENQEENSEQERGKHSLAFFVSHTFVSQGKIDGEREWLAAPSLALNYNYRLSEKWSIGLHNDIIIESFLIENSMSSEETLEREYPISNLIMGTYKITEAWGLAIGGGVEWEKNENFAVLRLGTEYGLELKDERLEIVFSLNYDALIEAYDSVNFGIGINKYFN